MKEIILSNGMLTQVNDEDYDYLNQWGWSKNSWGYVHRTTTINSKRTNLLLAEIILNRMGLIVLNDMEIDHKDRNRSNNQRNNLRIVTKAINRYNRNKFKNNTSGIKGVHWCKRDKFWIARINFNKQTIILGYFRNFDDAMKARKEAEIKYYEQT